MEATIEKRACHPITQDEAWPSVPSNPLLTHPHESEPTAMDVYSIRPMSSRGSRDTSVLSMDDIEAAQALEGLRTGITLRILDYILN